MVQLYTIILGILKMFLIEMFTLKFLMQYDSHSYRKIFFVYHSGKLKKL